MAVVQRIEQKSQLKWYFKNTCVFSSFPKKLPLSVTKSKFILLAALQARTWEIIVGAKNRDFIQKARRLRRKVDLCPKEPCYPGLDASFFYIEKRGRLGGKKQQ